jgi:hypothetical protein
METWSDGTGSSEYADGGILAGKTPAMCQQKISSETDGLARAQSLPVVEVGKQFARAQQSPLAPDLFEPDRHHPSVAGAYLSAATFYRFFTGRSPTQAAYKPPGLSEAEARRLASVASQ